ncbi:MAG: homoserine O-acetyltransferase, partial [Mesorhizobium sp.]
MAAQRAPRTNHEADQPSSPVLQFGPDKPLKLDAGTVLSPFQVAYQT